MLMFLAYSSICSPNAVNKHLLATRGRLTHLSFIPGLHPSPYCSAMLLRKEVQGEKASTSSRKGPKHSQTNVPRHATTCSSLTTKIWIVNADDPPPPRRSPTNPATPPPASPPRAERRPCRGPRLRRRCARRRPPRAPSLGVGTVACVSGVRGWSCSPPDLNCEGRVAVFAGSR